MLLTKVISSLSLVLSVWHQQKYLYHALPNFYKIQSGLSFQILSYKAPKSTMSEKDCKIGGEVGRRNQKNKAFF